MLGGALDHLHAYCLVTPQINMSSIQHWPFLTAVVERGHQFSLLILTQISVGPLALLSCWWVEDAYAKCALHTPPPVFLHGIEAAVIFFWVLLLGFQFSLSFFRISIKQFSQKDCCNNSEAAIFFFLFSLCSVDISFGFQALTTVVLYLPS